MALFVEMEIYLIALQDVKNARVQVDLAYIRHDTDIP